MIHIPGEIGWDKDSIMLFTMMLSSELITYLCNFQFHIPNLLSLETETTLMANEGVYCI